MGVVCEFSQPHKLLPVCQEAGDTLTDGGGCRVYVYIYIYIYIYIQYIVAGRANDRHSGRDVRPRRGFYSTEIIK